MSAAGAVLEALPRSRSLTRVAAHRFAHRPVAVSALAVLVGICLAGAFAPVLAAKGWAWIDLDHVKQGPSLAHVFGTDNVGRDVLTRTVYGTRTTVEIALAATSLATLVGVAAGAVAGYFGGWRDAIVMRLADIVTAYPAVVFTLAAIVYFRPVTRRTLVVVFSAFAWAIIARLVRAHVVSLRGTEFVEAARALGASETRILLHHVLPNALGTILVAATALVGQIVLIDATVEFFGYGMPSSQTPSLGNLVADVVQFSFGLSNDVATAGFGWWTWFFPGLVLVLILVCVNLVGDALDAALNPAATRG